MSCLNPKSLPAIALLLSAVQLAGCGPDKTGDVAGEAAATATPVGETRTYDWYLEGETPAGETTLVTTGDGRVTNQSFVHWNNREYRLEGELQLDEDGIPVSQRITGTSPFGAPIDERFDIEDGVASWSTPGENGAVEIEDAAFYLPNESGSLGSLGALVRAARGRIDGEIALLPSGSARVTEVSRESFQTAGGPVSLFLYSISGIGFTPLYVWLDEDLAVAAVDYGGYLSMVPDGFGTDALAKLSEIQTRESAAFIRRVSDSLREPLDRPLVIENVGVVDVRSGRVLEGRHVTVTDGKITAISAAAVDAPNALRVDGTGRSLMPGLWDMHGHFSLADGVLNIAGGVTNVRDIGNVHEQIMQLTAAFDSGEVIGPNTWRAGFIDKAGPFASGYAAETLDDALDRVDFYADNGYMQIKLYSSIEPDWVAPIAARARERGLRLSGHIPAYMSAEQAVGAGYNEIQHINMVFLNFLAGDREDTRKQIRFTLYGDEAGNLDLDSAEVGAFLDLLAENDVVVDPTAAIFDTMLRHLPGEPDPTFAAVVDHLPLSVARGLYNPEMDMTGREAAWARSAEKQAQMLKLLHERGIQLVPGSDNIAAFTLHRELEVYAEAGIPAADVLRIATLDSARTVGADDRKGAVEEGMDADLLLVEGNPLEDISAVRQGVLVVKGNAAYRPDRLYRAVGVKPFVPSVDIRSPGESRSRSR